MELGKAWGRWKEGPEVEQVMGSVRGGEFGEHIGGRSRTHQTREARISEVSTWDSAGGS